MSPATSLCSNTATILLSASSSITLSVLPAVADAMSAPSDWEIKVLSKFKWPGNIRQLKNVLQRYALLMQHNISLEEILSEEFSPKTLNDIEEHFAFPVMRASAPNWTFIQKALNENKGNKCRAAKSLNISRGCLCYQIKKHKFQNWDSCEKLAKCSSA